uniref:VPS9 domain-containing protein n=1 Tax=Arcella intermedia TaxID=1963864 RepID=A0A6B2KXT3_9EUKA
MTKLSTGEYYEGTWDKGVKHGVGMEKNPQTGEYYEGQWEQGKKHGFGKKGFPTGEKYQGEWKDDSMEGEGNLTYPNESGSFTGTWEGGKRVEGEYVVRKVKEGKKGRKVTVVTFRSLGKWVDDFPAPSGELLFGSGVKYIGEVGYTINNKYTVKQYEIHRHGYGEMFSEDKSKYIGSWKNDKKKGYGVLIKSNGEKYYGNWSRSKKSGYGVQIQLDGSYYEGKYESDERKGKGTLHLPNGDKVEGDWHASKVNTANYRNGKFTDFPRPLRAVFLHNVTAIQRTEDTSLFTSREKWADFVKDAFADVTMDKNSSAVFLVSLVNPNATSAPPELTGLISRFVRIFEWQYSNLKIKDKKDSLYALQTAVDDVNSFIECITKHVEDKFNFNQYKSIIDALIRAVFPRIYSILFPLYRQVNQMKEALLRAKIVQLKKVTPALIGVKEKFHLGTMVVEEGEDEIQFPLPALMLPVVNTPKKTGVTPHKRNHPQNAGGGALLNGRGSMMGHRLNTPPNRLSLQVGHPKPLPKVIKSVPSSSENEDISEGTESESISNDLSTQRPANPQAAGQTLNGETTEGSKRPIPYHKVISELEKLNITSTPVEKLDCLTKAATSILSCVDEYIKDKTEPIVMGAEDKFPVLIYALIRANIDDLYSNIAFLQDFITNHIGDEESKYRVSELTDAINYIQNLDWQLRDAKGVLSPLNMILSAVSWAVKASAKLKIDSPDPEAVRNQITFCISSLFKMFGNQKENLFQPLPIPPKFTPLVQKYESFFQSVIQLKEVGLRLEKSDSSYTVHFEHKLPLYVYTKISEACIVSFND